jgi:hypothetical protein
VTICQETTNGHIRSRWQPIYMQLFLCVLASGKKFGKETLYVCHIYIFTVILIPNLCLDCSILHRLTKKGLNLSLVSPKHEFVFYWIFRCLQTYVWIPVNKTDKLGRTQTYVCKEVGLIYGVHYFCDRSTDGQRFVL